MATVADLLRKVLHKMGLGVARTVGTVELCAQLFIQLKKHSEGEK